MGNKSNNSSTKVIRQKIGDSIQLVVEGIPVPTAKPKLFVFVLMPFHSGFDDIYQLGI